MTQTVALFGEAERGDFQTAYFCQSLPQLADNFGQPPVESQGLHFAVQLLLYKCNVIFFRVKEEGYSVRDYYMGLRFLENNQFVSQLSAIAMPGVGDSSIINATEPVCYVHNSILIATESDFYDYITA